MPVNTNMLIAIKILHTIIWVLFVAVIFYIVYSGVTGNITVFTWVGIGLIIGEGLVLAIFKMYCPVNGLGSKIFRLHRRQL
jgi:hypothetical protein